MRLVNLFQSDGSRNLGTIVANQVKWKQDILGQISNTVLSLDVWLAELETVVTAEQWLWSAFASISAPLRVMTNAYPLNNSNQRGQSCLCAESSCKAVVTTLKMCLGVGTDEGKQIAFVMYPLLTGRFLVTEECLKKSLARISLRSQHHFERPNTHSGCLLQRQLLLRLAFNQHYWSLDQWSSQSSLGEEDHINACEARASVGMQPPRITLLFWQVLSIP